jgi:hypothetical protein
MDKSNESIKALKVVKETEFIEEEVITGLKLMLSIGHQSTIKVHDIFKIHSNLAMTMDLGWKGDLKQRILLNLLLKQ